MEKLIKKLTTFSIALLISNSILATDSASDFMNKEDNIHQRDYRLVRIISDTSVGVGSALSVQKITTLIENIVNSELSNQLHQRQRLETQLKHANEIIDDLKLRLGLTKDYQTIVKLSDELEPQLTRKELLLEKYKKNLAYSNAIRSDLISGTKRFSDSKTNRKFRLYQGLKRLAKMGVVISIVDLAGQFITHAYGPNNDNAVNSEMIEITYDGKTSEGQIDIWEDDKFINTLEEVLKEQDPILGDD